MDTPETPSQTLSCSRARRGLPPGTSGWHRDKSGGRCCCRREKGPTWRRAGARLGARGQRGTSLGGAHEKQPGGRGWQRTAGASDLGLQAGGTQGRSRRAAGLRMGSRRPYPTPSGTGKQVTYGATGTGPALYVRTECGNGGKRPGSGASTHGGWTGAHVSPGP